MHGIPWNYRRIRKMLSESVKVMVSKKRLFTFDAHLVGGSALTTLLWAVTSGFSAAVAAEAGIVELPGKWSVRTRLIFHEVACELLGLRGGQVARRTRRRLAAEPTDGDFEQSDNVKGFLTTSLFLDAPQHLVHAKTFHGLHLGCWRFARRAVVSAQERRQ